MTWRRMPSLAYNPVAVGYSGQVCPVRLPEETSYDHDIPLFKREVGEDSAGARLKLPRGDVQQAKRVAVENSLNLHIVRGLVFVTTPFAIRFALLSSSMRYTMPS